MDAANIKAVSNTPHFIFFDNNDIVGEKLYAAGFPNIVAKYAQSNLMSLSEGNITNVNLIEYDKDKFMVISVPISEGKVEGL